MTIKTAAQQGRSPRKARQQPVWVTDWSRDDGYIDPELHFILAMRFSVASHMPEVFELSPAHRALERCLGVVDLRWLNDEQETQIDVVVPIMEWFSTEDYLLEWFRNRCPDVDKDARDFVLRVQKADLLALQTTCEMVFEHACLHDRLSAANELLPSSARGHDEETLRMVENTADGCKYVIIGLKQFEERGQRYELTLTVTFPGL